MSSTDLPPATSTRQPTNALAPVSRAAGASRLDARRTEIVDVAARLFAKRGYDATGVAELCAAVGMGKGALYHYIGSKENLLALIHERVMVEVSLDTEKIVALDLPARRRLLALGESQMRIIARYPDHLRVFLHEYRALSPENAATFRRRRREFERLLERTLEDGVAEGEFEIADIQLAVLGWLGMHNYAYLWYGTGSKHRLDEIAHHFFDLFLKGIAARA